MLLYNPSFITVIVKSNKPSSITVLFDTVNSTLKSLSSATNIEILPLFPDVEEHVQILNKLYDSFKISSDEYGYELKIRSVICDIWCETLKLTDKLLNKKGYSSDINDKLKLMLIYIHEQYSQKISIAQIANAAFVSERECFRIFNKRFLTGG